MIVESGYMYPGSGPQSPREAARQSDRWLREALNSDVPRWGEGGFLETCDTLDDMADVEMMIERHHVTGHRCA